MVAVFRGTKQEHGMDGYLVSNLDFCAERAKIRWDNLIIIDGDEGVGKSTLGKDVGYYMGQKLGTGFSSKQIFFKIEEMEEYAKNERNKVIVWDEAALGGLGEDWQDDNQKRLIKLLITCRKYGHFFIFIVPKIDILRRYLAVHRSIALLRCYSPDRLTRGFFRAYAKNSKEDLYRLEKEHKNSRGVMPDFFGKYADVTGILIDEDDYEKRKDEAIQSIGEKESKTEQKWKLRFVDAVILLKKCGLKGKQLSKELKIDPGQLSNLMGRYADDLSVELTN